MKGFNLFIAGAKQLDRERKELTVLVSNINAEQIRLGVDMTILPCSYENFGDCQSEYNRFIETCDLFFLIVDKQLGQRSLAELDVAINSFGANSRVKPLIYIFVRKYDDKSPDVLKLEAKLDEYFANNQYDFYYIDYESIESLCEQANSRLQFFIKQQIIKRQSVQLTPEVDSNADAIFTQLANAMSELFEANVPVYVNFPHIDQSKISEYLKMPLSGSYATAVKIFANKLDVFISALNDAKNSTTVRQMLVEGMSAPNIKRHPTEQTAEKLVNMITWMKSSLSNIRLGVFKPIIEACLACNIKFDRYNNANLRLFAFLGFMSIRVSSDMSSGLYNLGAMAIHNLYYAMPATYRELIYSDLKKALDSAESVPDFYCVTFD
jgi:hypothetical protein